MTEVAASSDANPILVVLGAHPNLLLPEIDTEKTSIVINNEWKKGMASSIVSGLTTLLEKYPIADAVIFMMCDQPFISSSLLNNLILTQQQTGKTIVSCSYDNTTGPPALFHKSIFPELLQLNGDKGARAIVERHHDEMATVLFPEGSIDIDTISDYENLLKGS